MDTQRLILFFIFGFSVLMLWDAWEKDHRPKPVAQVVAPASVPGPVAKPDAQPAAAAAAKLIDVVVLPTPPFWLATKSFRTAFSSKKQRLSPGAWVESFGHDG